WSGCSATSSPAGHRSPSPFPLRSCCVPPPPPEKAVHRRSAMKTLRTLAALIPIAALSLIATPAQAAPTLSMLGADVSSLQRSQDLGARYYDTAGTARD